VWILVKFGSASNSGSIKNQTGISERIKQKERKNEGEVKEGRRSKGGKGE
jgi:hypothetical protein